MTDIPKCPKCGSEYTYFDGMLYVCPDCAHEFSATDEAEGTADVAKDSNGAELFDGDAVTVIKDLKVKGSSMVIKRGTKVKSIRLTENPEEVDCKIDGSSIVLKHASSRSKIFPSLYNEIPHCVMDAVRDF